MKNILLTTLSILLLTLSSFSQDFEGEMEFKMEYTNVPEGMEMYKAMAAQKMFYKIKGPMVRVDMKQSMFDMTSITNTKTGTVLMLSNMLGKKTAEYLDYTDDDITDTVKMVKKSGTKTILGYVCKRADLVGESGNTLVTYWYSNKFPGYKSPEYPNMQLDGFPLEYTINVSGIEMTATAITITEKSISDSEFEIPKGYKIKKEKK